MNEVLNQYLLSCLHPWHTQELLRSKRYHNKEVDGSNVIELVQNRDEKKVEENLGVTFLESLSISWLFRVFYASYSLIGMFMGLHLFESFSLPGTAISTGQSWVSSIAIFFLLLKLVFFPLYFWLYGKFWINIIKIFAQLFEKDDMGNIDKVSEEIYANSMSSHTFLVIPIFGELFHRIGNIIFIFGGLRRNLQLSVLQSSLVIICPLLLILFTFFLMGLSLAMLLSGF